MSDTQSVWLELWHRATADPAPFEIADAAPQVASALGTEPQHAERMISGLLKELERLPDGKQFFTREGNAVVPLPEFFRCKHDDETALAFYPFEL